MLKGLILENFKAFSERQEIPLAPITLIYGENSSGKSSIIQSLLLLTQTAVAAEADGRVGVWDIALDEIESNGKFVDLGDVDNFTFNRNGSAYITIGLVYDADRSVGGNLSHAEAITRAMSRPDFPNVEVSTSYPQSYTIEQIIDELDQVEIPPMVAEEDDLSCEFDIGQDENGSSRCERIRIGVNDVLVLSAERLRNPDDDKIYTLSAVNTMNPLAKYRAGIASDFVLSGIDIDDNEWGNREALRKMISGDYGRMIREYYAEGNSADVLLLSNIMKVMIARVVLEPKNDTIATYWDDLVDVVTTNGWGEPDRYFDGPGTIRAVMEADASYWMTGMAAAINHLATDLQLSVTYCPPYRMLPNRVITEQRGERRGDFDADAAWRSIIYGGAEDIKCVNGELKELEIPYVLDVEESKLVGVKRVLSISIRDNRTGSMSGIHDVGHGIGQVIPVIVACTLSRSSVVVVEQPELHLHPRQQAALGSLLLRSVREYHNQVIVETHSEHLILRLQRLIREQKLSHEDLCVLYVNRDEEGSHVSHIRVDRYGDIIDPWPGGFFEERHHEMFSQLVRS